MKEQLRTEAENRKIGWYFVIFSGKERPAYFDGKNWIVWGNMGFWNDSDLSKISDRLIPYFHAQQLEKPVERLKSIIEACPKGSFFRKELSKVLKELQPSNPSLHTT